MYYLVEVVHFVKVLHVNYLNEVNYGSKTNSIRYNFCRGCVAS
jgi:hypothetical protein